MRFSRTVEIKQSPRGVWATLEDFDQWRKWATPLGMPKRVSPGPWQLGWLGRLGNTTYEITDLNPGHQMIWFGSGLGSTSVWTILVEPVRGRTETTFIIETSGWAASLFGRFTAKGFDQKLKTAAENFRKLAESTPSVPRVQQTPTN
jgi:uncharacterized protein YndB with AHSA1/START domain